MSNTELINAYFDNELNASEKKSFEERLSQDTELQREFKFQEDIIDGIREARRQSLKARLDQVHVGGGTTGSGWTAGKITGLIGLVAVAGFGIYYFFPENDPAPADQTEQVITLNEDNSAQEIITEEQPAEESLPETQEPAQADSQPAAEQPANEVEETTEADEPEVEVKEEDKNPVIAPSFEDPRDNDTNVDMPEDEITGKAVISARNLEVAVDNTSKRYNFHYALENGQLMLYGDFQNTLYEILEFNTETMKTWFLSYKGAYYSLKPTSGKIESLEKVTDTALLKTLQEASKE